MKNWTDDELPRATTDLSRLKSDMDEFGYCIIAEAIDAGRAAEIGRRIDAQAKAERKRGLTVQDGVQSEGDGNQWVYMLINKGRVFLDLLRAPAPRAIVEHVLGPNYLLSDFAATITHPGNQRMGMHIDQWWLPVPRGVSEEPVRAGGITRRKVQMGPPRPSVTPINPPVVCNALWMISDFEVENGATRIVPRSHLSGHHPDPSAPLEAVNITSPMGTCLVFEGRTWHAADLNRSNAPRYGITTYYCGPQFRQMANFTYGTHPKVIEALDPDLLRLLGFKPWGGYGAIGDPSAESILQEKTIGELTDA
jgi:ectoine hydroxylase-related dioxygenase (phytanoyl-CoA dioxygenase family)